MGELYIMKRKSTIVNAFYQEGTENFFNLPNCRRYQTLKIFKKNNITH